jgi:hypothetical protein
MEQARPEFFASAGFATDKHGAFDIGGTFNVARNAIHFRV